MTVGRLQIPECVPHNNKRKAGITNAGNVPVSYTHLDVYKRQAKSLLKTNLTDEQKKQVKSGKKLDTTGMSGSQKKKADA